MSIGRFESGTRLNSIDNFDFSITKDLSVGEAMEVLPTDDRVICASFGLRDDGMGLYFPEYIDAVRATFSEKIYSYDNEAGYGQVSEALGLYRKMTRKMLLAVESVMDNSYPATAEQKARAKKVFSYLEWQGYKSGLSFTDINEVAKRKHSRFRQLIRLERITIDRDKSERVPPEREEGAMSPAEILEARGFKPMGSRNKNH